MIERKKLQGYCGCGVVRVVKSGKRFEELEVWQLGRELVRAIYALSKGGEFGNDFGLKSQIRRASVSICSNIAEGYERDGDREFAQYLSQAKGSAGEVRSQIHHALDVGYISQSEFQELYDHCVCLSSKISRFMHYLKNKPMGGTKYKPQGT